MITRRIARPSCRRRIIQISALSTFDVKKLVVGLWVGSAGPPSGVHRFTRPFCRRCAPGLNWPGRASGAVTLKKLECSKQAYALCSGPHARYTDVFNEYIALADRPGKSLKFHRDGDRSLQLLVFNEEFLNPVNHRVFERKLRPKPSGRGHACLGVTHRVAPNHASLIGTHGIGAEIGLPCLWCGWPKLESPSVDARLVVPSLKIDGLAVRIVVWRSVLSGGPGPSPLEGGAREGESPVVPGPCRTTRRCLRVGLFGNAAPIGRQRVLEIVGREANGGRRCVPVGCGTAIAGPPIDSGRGPVRIGAAAKARAVDRLVEMPSRRSWLAARAVSAIYLRAHRDVAADGNVREPETSAGASGRVIFSV
ncbi:hypothetical protein L1887_55987 [Cichorium endivia]|nr:hypothetical protein L1887_55987 [Cichorium endivia]